MTEGGIIIQIMLRKPLRRVLRLILFLLARWALNKHKPSVIAIAGEGKTGIIREAIYTVLKHRFPVRRNLEYPDAEFVLPLTVLGAAEYPTNSFGWLRVVLRSIAQLTFLPPHKHFLVLEIGYTNKEIFDYFWQITQPQVLIICGNAPYLTQSAPHTFKVKETPDLKGYLQTAHKVAQHFRISKEERQKALQNFTLPPARIRLYPATGGGLIIDATYQYFPPSKEALEEILESLPGKKIILTPKTRDKPKNIRDGEVAVLIGPARKMWSDLLRLAKTPWI